MLDILEAVLEESNRKFVGISPRSSSIHQAVLYIKSLSHEQLQAETNEEQKSSDSGEGESTSRFDFFQEDSILLSEQLLADQQYASAMDYDFLFLTSQVFTAPSDDEYWAAEAVSDTRAETMTLEEAEEALQDIQYATILRVFNDVSYVSRRRFALWADLNPAERELFHRLHALTGDVNYSRAF